MKRLTNLELAKLSKRERREYQIALVVDGNPRQLMVRVGEGDDGMCEKCMELEGQEGNLAYHTKIGLPGPDSCEHGDDCRCVLMAVDG